MDLLNLEKGILFSDYETATAIYKPALEKGIPGHKAIAMVYRQGVRDGKKMIEHTTVPMRRQLAQLKRAYPEIHEHLKTNPDWLPEIEQRIAEIQEVQINE